MSHAERTESQELNRAMVNAKAAELWGAFDDNEKTLVRFGMFPAAKMEKAEAELVAAEIDCRESGRLLSVALMEIAEANGGMIA